MKKIIGHCLILFLISALGCLPAQRGRTVTPPETDGQPPRLAFSHEIEKKIRFFSALLEEQGLSEDDKKIASNFLDAYRELQNLSSAKPSEEQYLRVIHDLYSCLSLIDKKYFDTAKDMKADHWRTMSLFSKKRDDILESYLSGDFQDVIDSCIALKTVFGPDALTPDIGLLFALSLAQKGMLDEAVNIGEGIARELETSPDIVQLRTGIAEWYLQQGQREKAILVYEKLADTLDENGIDVQSLSRRIAAAEKTALLIGPISDPTQSQWMKEVTVEHLLEEVEKLLEENRFSEARDLLRVQAPKVLSTPEKETLNQALKRLELAEENYLEKKISMISMNRDMEQARRLLEEERFEEVISKLEALESEEEDSREIKELKQFAIEKLINRERNRAAKIFLAAKETQDPVRKEEYFRKALGILNALVEDYPLSPLNEKLTSHIKIVEEALDKLDKSKND